MFLLKTSKHIKASSLLETVIAMTVTILCLAIAAFIYMSVFQAPNSFEIFKNKQQIILLHISKEWELTFDTDYKELNTDIMDHQNSTSYILKTGNITLINNTYEK